MSAYAELRSQLVDAKVLHQRLRRGEPNVFRQRVFYGLIDVEEIPTLGQRLWSFSANGQSIYSLGSRDFISFGHPDIKSNIASWLVAQGYNLVIDRLIVFAHLRTLGVNFNPLALFFLESQGQTYCIAEVDNTFGESKLFFLGPLGADGSLLRRIAKDYYVSPFIEHDADFIFDIRLGKAGLSVQVTTVKGREPILMARMEGVFRPITDKNLLVYLLKMPMTPIKVFAAIHWQAARLYLKRIPFLKKKDHLNQQRDYYVRKNYTEHLS